MCPSIKWRCEVTQLCKRYQKMQNIEDMMYFTSVGLDWFGLLTMDHGVFSLHLAIVLIPNYFSARPSWREKAAGGAGSGDWAASEFPAESTTSTRTRDIFGSTWMNRMNLPYLPWFHYDFSICSLWKASCFDGNWTFTRVIHVTWSYVLDSWTLGLLDRKMWSGTSAMRPSTSKVMIAYLHIYIYMCRYICNTRYSKIYGAYVCIFTYVIIYTVYIYI